MLVNPRDGRLKLIYYRYIDIHSTTKEVRHHIYMAVSCSKMKRGVRSNHISIFKEIRMIVQQLLDL